MGLPVDQLILGESLKDLLEQVHMAGFEDESSPDVLPSAEVKERATRWLMAAVAEFQALQPAMAIPTGHVVATAGGGLRIEWWAGNQSSVHLLISPTDADKDGLFCRYEVAEPGRLLQGFSSLQLAAALQRLIQAADRQ